MDSRSSEAPVDKLPLEIIGDILSRVEVARDVIRASLTRRKWREAYRKHLHALSFNVDDDDRVFRELPTSDLEMLITKTLVQSPSLRKLKILMDKKHKFSAVAVMAWLMFSRETLSELFYMVITSPGINVLDIYGQRKLETLSLCKYTIRGVEMKLHRFPYLTSLSLTRVKISEEVLNRLLLALPKLEKLELIRVAFRVVDDDDEFDPREMTVILHCPTLKSLFLRALEQFEFILENGGIEYLHVQCCTICSFKVVGSKSLRHLKLSYTGVRHLEIEEGDNLEIFEIISSHVSQSNLFSMNIQAPKLKTYRIWDFRMGATMDFRRVAEIILDRSSLIVDLERVAFFSPQLSHLVIGDFKPWAVFCDEELFGRGLEYNFEGLSRFENVGVLEIGCRVLDGFLEWAEKLLRHCPNLSQLIVHMLIREYHELGHLVDGAPSKSSDEMLRNKMLRKYQCKDLAARTSLAVEMMRNYPNLQVEFTYVYWTDFPDD